MDADVAIAAQGDRPEITRSHLVGAHDFSGGFREVCHRVGPLQAINLAGIDHAFEVFAHAENCRAILGLVAADAFEYGGGIADDVGKHVNRGVFPSNQLAVMPYFFSRLHAHRRSPRAPEIQGAAYSKSIAHANVHAPASDVCLSERQTKLDGSRIDTRRGLCKSMRKLSGGCGNPPTGVYSAATPHWGLRFSKGDFRRKYVEKKMGHARAVAGAWSRNGIRAGCENRDSERAKGHRGRDLDPVFRHPQGPSTRPKLQPKRPLPP